MTQSELYTYARRLVNANSTDWAESDLVIDLNDALDDLWVKMKNARGILEFDDSNYTDLPAGTFNLTANTASYAITTDENSNEIITVHKVAVLDGASWVDIPRKKVSEPDQDGLLDAATDTAKVPSFYYEVGNRVYFSPVPSTTVSNGVKIWFDRAPKAFASGGTTFEPGIPSVYHSLLGEKAAFKYALVKNMQQARSILSLIELGERRMMEYEGHRRKDEARRISAASHSER